MKNLFLTLVVGLLPLCLIAQNNQIKGEVLDHENNPVAFANIILNNASDSTMTKVETTDIDGFFEISNISNEKYWIDISYVGLSDYHSNILEMDNTKLDLGTIQMEVVSNELSEVVVIASRPILEVKPDKLVFNVEGSVNASGSDALELLRKAPGVVLDNNDNISLAGKNGVKIFINGKPSPLSGDDLISYLRSLNSDDIDNIEIISNPPAKYDAEGNAGIINIVMRKDQRLGANGRVNVGYNQGRHSSYYGGISGNYKNKNINTFGRYSGGRYQGYNTLNLNRRQEGITYDQTSLRDFIYDEQGFTLGTDFFINDNNTLGILAEGNHVNEISTADPMSKTSISTINEEGIDRILFAETISKEKSKHLNLNLNYQLKIGSDKGKTNDKDESNSTAKHLNIDADYGIYQGKENDFQPNIYKDPTETITLSESIYNNLSNTDIQIGTFKIDYDQKLWDGDLGLGIKTAVVKTDNSYEVYDIIDNQNLFDETNSRDFEYIENVNAIYASYGKQIDKFGFQLGTRLEQTYSKGELMAHISTDEDLVKRTYVDFFPSIGLMYQVNDKHAFQLNYSRRLRRPNYENLNPFELKLDELVFERGNPFLNPEYSNSIKLSHTFNSRLNTSLSYTHTKNRMAEIIVQTENKIFNTWLNVAEQNSWNIDVSAPFPITKWWNTFTNLSGSYRQNSTIIPETNETETLRIYTFNGYLQNNFDLPWGMKLEVSGWYTSPFVEGGFLRLEQMYSIDAGLQKSFLKGKAKLKIGIDDIFRSRAWRAVNNYGNDFARAAGRNDSRRIKLNFSYSFGNQKVKSRNRNKGSEAEADRI